MTPDCGLKDRMGREFKIGDVVLKLAGEHEQYDKYRVGFRNGSYCLVSAIEENGNEVPITFVPLYYDEPEKLTIIYTEE